MTGKILLTVLFLAGGVAAQRTQLIRFFPAAECKIAAGNAVGYEDFKAKGNVSRAGIGAVPFLSYCVMAGAWRVELAWVQSVSDFSIDIGDYCTSCKSRAQNSKQWGGIRPIAGSDLTKPSISLYTDRDFGGTEIEINGPQYTFDTTRSFLSFGFTSWSNWTWQAYDMPRWRGNSTCLRSSQSEEITLINPTSLNVGSLKLGCSRAGPPRYKEIGLMFTIMFAFLVPSVAVIL